MGRLADVAQQAEVTDCQEGRGLHASGALQLHIPIHRHDTVSGLLCLT